MKKELITLFEYLERERGIKREVVIKAITESIQAAARKNVKGLGEKVHVEIDPKTGELEVLVPKKIVEKVEDPKEEISLEDARVLEPDCEIGQTLGMVIAPEEYGRIAAQAARQLMTQKLKGAERDVIYAEYLHKVGELISGTVKGFTRGSTVVVDLGKVEAYMPSRNYPRSERFNIGDKVHAILLEVRNNSETGGAEVILSRSHENYVAALFEQEVPELADKTVEIVKIKREAGYRTKMAVRSNDQKVDPVGACVGSKGMRIQSVVADLRGEKIDVVRYNDNLHQFLENLVHNTKNPTVDVVQEYKVSADNKIQIVVKDEDYPNVIGKGGVNRRLISEMIECGLDVKKMSEYHKLLAVHMAELSEKEDPTLDDPIKIDGVSNMIIENLSQAGIKTLRDFMKGNPEEIGQIPGVKYYEYADKILDQLSKRSE